MWSPTKLTRALPRLLFVCVLAVSLAGCGYGFGTESASVLEPTAPGTLPTIKVKSVENPTLYPWLSYLVRSELRDELAARGIAQWVDSGRADYEISIKIESFQMRSWFTDSEDRTTLFSPTMTLTGIVHRGDSNAEVWRSSALSYTQSYETAQERVAAADLTRELVRRLITRMRSAF